MSFLLQIDFPFPGPWGRELVDQYSGLAMSIADEPGLLWKIWTENPESNEAGGIYLFSERDRAEAYLSMHTQRLEAAGISDIRSRIFEVNEGLSWLCRAPLPELTQGRGEEEE